MVHVHILSVLNFIILGTDKNYKNWYLTSNNQLQYLKHSINESISSPVSTEAANACLTFV